MTKLQIEVSSISIPKCLAEAPLSSLNQFKDYLQRLVEDSVSSQFLAKTCHTKIKLLVESTENNTKMFTDLKKGEVRNYYKAKDTFKSKFKRLYDTRYEIDRLEKKIAEEQTFIDQSELSPADGKKKKQTITTLNQSLLKLRVEYDQMNGNSKDLSEEFNKTKLKFARLFNAYAENTENRIKDNLVFYIEKITDMVKGISLNKIVEPELSKKNSTDQTTNDAASYSEMSTPEDAKETWKVDLPKDYRVVSKELYFEKENTVEPEIYLKYMSANETELNILRELETYGSRIPSELAQEIMEQASRVVLGKAEIGSIVKVASSSLEAQTYGNRIAIFLILLEPKFGRVKDKASVEAMRDQLLESLNKYASTPAGQVPEDKQFMFYTLKLLEMTYFPDSKIRSNLTGRRTVRAIALETLTESPHFDEFMSSSSVRDQSFWDLYYRHNNYFVEKNFYFFQRFKIREEIRAHSLECLWIIWTCCGQKDYNLAFEHMTEIRKKFKLVREVPEFALQQSETRVCEILDARVDTEPLNILSPEIWFKVTDFLTSKEKLSVAQTCRSLYHDLRVKAIGDELAVHPQLRMKEGPLRETLWLALVPQVSSFKVENKRPEA